MADRFALLQPPSTRFSPPSKQSLSHSDPDTASGTASSATPSRRRKPCSPRPSKPRRLLGAAAWDSLSKLHLTRSALTELDRRNQESQARARSPDTEHTEAERVPCYNDIKRFARRGGPDLRHLRGFAYRSLTVEAMHAAPTAAGRKRRGAPQHLLPAPLSKKTCNTTSVSKPVPSKPIGTLRSSSYDANSSQKLIDSNVYPENHDFPDGSSHPLPHDFDEIQDRLRVPRASLSPSTLSHELYQQFRAAHRQAKGEPQVESAIGPMIRGTTGQRYQSAGNKPFNNLLPLAPDVSQPQPDQYDGMAPELIRRQIRHDLSEFIVPNKNDSLPAAPNFFVEWKSASGRADVALLQACHDGAVGARAIHQLKNYRAETEQYDNRADSFSSTYHAATNSLKMYSTHMTAPTVPGDPPAYHMTQLDGYDSSGSARNFRDGVTAWRDLRDLATEKRISTVAHVTRMAEQQPPPPPPPPPGDSSASTTTQAPTGVPQPELSSTSGDELALEATPASPASSAAITDAD